MSIQGLDVSEFQGDIDWEQVKSAGYQFAMLRAGYGFGTLDQQFQKNAAECNRIGFPIGVYWFCYALSPETARQEADGCINAISPYRLDYPVCYDIEQASITYAAQNGVSFTPSLTTYIVQSFCNRVEDRGYYAMYYSNRSFLNTYFPADFSARYALWYSFYNSQFDGANCGMWQYTNQGRIPGISGNVDLNTSFENYPDIIKKAGLNHLYGSLQIPDTPSLPMQDYITYVVQQGDTLSGIAHRYGTTYQTIAALNHLSNPDLIYPGQAVRIPEGADPTARFYTIQPEDTLNSIALKSGITVSELQHLNGISDTNLLYAGSTFRIK